MTNAIKAFLGVLLIAIPAGLLVTTFIALAAISVGLITFGVIFYSFANYYSEN